MEFYNINIWRFNSSFFISFACSLFGHRVTYNLSAVFEGLRIVSSKLHSKNLDSLIFSLKCLHGLLITNYSSSSTVWCRTTLQLSQKSVNFGTFKNFLDRVCLSKLWVRIVKRMFVVFGSYFSKVLRFSTINFHMLLTCVSEK